MVTDEEMKQWYAKETAVTLTNKQWSDLTCYIHMTTKYREGERKCWEELGAEKNADGSAKFPNAAGNMAFWQETEQALKDISSIIDARER